MKFETKEDRDLILQLIQGVSIPVSAAQVVADLVRKIQTAEIA